MSDEGARLDPQVAAFLQKLREHGGRSVVDGSVEEARAMVRGFAKLQGPPPPMASVRDEEIPGPAGPLIVRVYHPPADGPLPVLVFLHGGGFALGDLDVTDVPCRAIAAAAPCVVVSVDYRLAPEHPHPAAPEDAYAAVAWAAEQRVRLGGDDRPVAVGGDSAGGNLSAVVALMARDRGGPDIGLQVLIYPSTELDSTRPSHRDNAEGYLLTQAEIDWFHERYVREPGMVSSPYVSPLKADDLSGLPPALVITAGFDPLRDDGRAYAEALTAAGVDVRLAENPTMIHGFIWLGGIVDHVAGVFALIGEHVRTTLR